MLALIDGDIIRYEAGYAAEVSYRYATGDPESMPPFEYVRKLLDQRIAGICEEVGAGSYRLYITEGETFRYKLATVKPYKGGRVSKAPFHFANLTMWMTHHMPTTVVTGIEADDQLAIDHTSYVIPTTLCSRDKDLRQVPGRFYSWELGRQPSFGPVEVERFGSLTLTKNPLKLTGTGYSFFAAQVLMGDRVDNIPGLPGCGPRAAFDLLVECYTLEDLDTVLVDAYDRHYGHEGEERLYEQARLCWMTRSLHPDGSPVLWEPGIEKEDQ